MRRIVAVIVVCTGVWGLLMVLGRVRPTVGAAICAALITLVLLWPAHPGGQATADKPAEKETDCADRGEGG